MKTFVKVFAVIYLPFLAVSLLVFYFTNNLMLESAQKELLEEMKNKWVILASSEISAERDLEKHQRIADISEKTHMRITLIEKSGKVIDDSYLEMGQFAQLENHKTRPEVIKAIENKEGYSIRYSSTTNIEMFYYARMVNESLILRISYPATYIHNLKSEFLQQNASIFLILFLVTAVIALYLAQRISVPVQKMNYIAEHIEAGDTNIIFPQFTDATMSKIAGLIYRIYYAMISKNEKLVEEQEKLNHIFNILEEGIILVNNNNEVIHFNPRAEKALGITLENSINLLRDLNDFELIKFFNEILSAQENEAWKEKEYKSKTFEVNLRVTAEEKLIVFKDISDASKYQHYKSELIANISHELRTPLSMILGYAETILDDPDMEPKTSRRFLEKIFNSSKRLNDIISDLLELHRLEHMGSEFLVEVPASIPTIIQDLRERYCDQTEKRLHFESDLQSLAIHDAHIFSILTNLIENAIKYSKGNNIYIEIQRFEENVVFSVEDEGPVIPLNVKERLFERFYTISQSRNKAKSGTGLGLPIVKHISQLYLGNIAVTNGSKEGNRFSVYLKEKKMA